MNSEWSKVVEYHSIAADTTSHPVLSGNVMMVSALNDMLCVIVNLTASMGPMNSTVVS